MRFHPGLASMLAFVATLPAQSPPLFRLQPAANPGQLLQSLLLGPPGRAFATWLDATGGPIEAFGESLWLGITPALVQIDAGQLDVLGARARAIPTPASPALAGVAIFAQSLVLDPAAPNGTFRASNGQSTIFHAKAAAIVLEFRDAVAEGVSGGFDATVKERLMPVPVSRRTHTFAQSGAIPFPLPVRSPLTLSNGRAQHVYRAADLAATGSREHVTALRWKPVGAVVADAFPRVQITLAHSTVVPDFTIDPFSALPKYPASGLGLTFAANSKAQDVPVVVYDGPYAIQPAALRPDGYLPWPALRQAFPYNGFDSLLVDVRAVAGPATLAANGFSVLLPVQSSPLPNARVFAPGNGVPGPIDPFAVTQAQQGDNSLYELQLELVRSTAVAVTPYVATPGPLRKYSSALVAAARPPNTAFLLEFEGAQDAAGRNASGFLPDAAWLTSYPWIRVRVTFDSDPFGGARPSLDTVVIPVE